MKNAHLVSALCLALAACVPAAPEDGTPTGPTQVQTETGTVTILPPPEQGRTVSIRRTMTDRCGAEGLQELVGQPETIFFRMTFPDTTRFIGPGDAVTQDLNPRRLNFDIGGNGRITRVWCG